MNGRGLWSGNTTSDPWRLLALAVVNQAVIETRAGNQEARRWLLEHGAAWLEACGESIDPQYWQKWIQHGCKRKGGSRGVKGRKGANKGECNTYCD